MTGGEKVVPVDLDKVLAEPPLTEVDMGEYCLPCDRSPARHWNPNGRRRWTCEEIQTIEAECAYWERPFWRRVWEQAWRQRAWESLRIPRRAVEQQ